MSCLLFKLHFDAPVHFGVSDSAQSLYESGDCFCADTLFSALCHTALSLYGKAGLSELCDWVRRDELRLSDGMPWAQEDFFLPKAFLPASEAGEAPADLRKRIKKTRWIPVRAFASFLESLSGGEMYDPRAYASEFGSHFGATRAAIRPGEDALPYGVGGFAFRENCGLYVLAQCAPAIGQRLCTLMEGLGMSGIGGKVSTGYGRFTVVNQPMGSEQPAQVQWLSDAVGRKASHYLLLSASLPREDELEQALEGAYFQLVRRGGFVQSSDYASTARKKRTQYFLAAGAVVRHPFEGEL